jgi:hypothetical protein
LGELHVRIIIIIIIITTTTTKTITTITIIIVIIIIIIIIIGIIIGVIIGIKRIMQQLRRVVEKFDSIIERVHLVGYGCKLIPKYYLITLSLSCLRRLFVTYSYY